MNQAISQMDQATQQNAALVEQAAAAAESLQDQAASLAQVVGVFKLDGPHLHPAAKQHAGGAVWDTRGHAPGFAHGATALQANLPAPAAPRGPQRLIETRTL